jgi:hypothetical protein
MTYKELLEKLQQLPPERLNDDVTVWVNTFLVTDYWADEFVPVAKLVENKQGSLPDTDVLDYGHFVLELKN